MTTADRGRPVRRRRGLAFVAGANAVAAWGGTVGLAGGGLSFGDELDRRLPFESMGLAAAALACIVATPLSILAALAWTGHPATDRWAVLCGSVLVGWIALQLCFLRALSWFHPTYVALGIALVVAGSRHARRR